jgi:hypothetical protein
MVTCNMANFIQIWSGNTINSEAKKGLASQPASP